MSVDKAVPSATSKANPLSNISDRLAHVLFALAAAVPTLIGIAIVLVFCWQSILFFQDVSPWEFLSDRRWTPLFSNPQYGILVLINGTFLIAAIAMVVAIPLGTLAAIYLSEYANDPLRRILKATLETLSGIPTIVFGYFAITFITPALRHILPSLSLFNALSAGLATGLLIIPIVSSICEDTLRNVPTSLRQGAFILGFTKAETIQHVLLPAALPGLLASYTLAASRCLGETMIAAIAAGQRPLLTLNPLVPIESITAYIIQVSLGDIPSNSLRFHTIFAAGFVLFLITLTLNGFGRWLLHRYSKAIAQFGIPSADDRLATLPPDLPAWSAQQPLPAYAFQNTLSQRQRNNTLLQSSSLLSALIGLITLTLMVLIAFRSGFTQLDWQFLTEFPSRHPSEAGIYPALIGTLLLLFLTAIVALPIGISAAIYLEEYVADTPISRILEVLIANLAAVPSILYGLLGLALFVRELAPLTGGRSLLSAALVLAMITLPLVIITTRTALRTVSHRVRQAGLSVGMSRLQVLYYIVLPSAAPGILTGTMMALSRVAGEAAALIAIGAIAFVSFAPNLSLTGLQAPFSTLPTQIFFWASRPQSGFQMNAAAAILVLGGLVLSLNIISVILRDRFQQQSP